MSQFAWADLTEPTYRRTAAQFLYLWHLIMAPYRPDYSRCEVQKLGQLPPKRPLTSLLTGNVPWHESPDTGCQYSGFFVKLSASAYKPCRQGRDALQPGVVAQVLVGGLPADSVNTGKDGYWNTLPVRRTSSAGA